MAESQQQQRLLSKASMKSKWDPATHSPGTCAGKSKHFDAGLYNQENSKGMWLVGLSEHCFPNQVSTGY